jgi:hypothetical protein
MRISVLALLALALAGCGTSPQVDKAAALQACASFHIPPGMAPEEAHNDCLLHDQQAERGFAQRSTQTDTDSEDAAAMVLLGSTAFVNGWNTRYQRPMVTCYTGGSITQCY